MNYAPALVDLAELICVLVLSLTKTLSFGPLIALDAHTLAWKIPWTEEPGGLQSMGSLRVRHD